MTIFTRVTASGAAAVLVFGVAACGSSTTASTAPAASSSPASVAMATSSAPMMDSTSTGMPMSSTAMTGMMSTTAAAPMASAPAGPHNQADITFAEMMLVHHQGAIDMADLTPSRATSSKVEDLAVKIKAEQTPEIVQMQGWLAAWMPANANGMQMSSGAVQSAPGMNGDNSSPAMPGMMSTAQTNRLKAAKGATFDKMFLEMMITHHQGAVTMAKTEKASGQNAAAVKLADSIIGSQTAEIAVMQELLMGL